MNRSFIWSLIFVLFCAAAAEAQSVLPSPTPTRQRVISSATPQPSPNKTVTSTPIPTPKAIVVTTDNLPTPTPSPVPVYTPRPSVSPSPYTTVSPTPYSTPSPIYTPPAPYKLLSLAQIKTKIADAKRLMQTRPMPTALTDSFLATDIIRIAYYDWRTSQIDFATLTKTVFLAKDAEVVTTSGNGKYLRVRILRANGVNTAVTIFDEYNQPHTPLLVQYPIEKFGSLREMAFYVSTHPAIVTPEVVNAGKFYVRNTIDIAREKLKEKNIYISPQIADIAERLSTVEHVDHQRFWNEFQPNLYNEIFALYALNENDTYRYSVSSAGAGGMVQMIAPTYKMVRDRYYSVGLIPDFVSGMRNHVNAAQAMLLYMQMTWGDLSSSETVYNAIASGIATQAELMAAGYNSNPAKLPGYIKRGGANWKNLIPRETKIYLQIYTSLERAVPMTPRTK